MAIVAIVWLEFMYRHKRHESLSGIETFQSAQTFGSTSRHKRHESLSGIETLETQSLPPSPATSQTT